MDEIKIEDLSTEQKTQVRDGISAVENTNAALNAVLDDNPSATRTAIGAASVSAPMHSNYNLPFLALRNSLQNKLSTDIVIIGDSTGDGTDRWPYRLATAIRDAFPAFDVHYHWITPGNSKAWSVNTSLRNDGPRITSRYIRPGTPAVWSSSGVTYAAGSVVTRVISTTTYTFFCTQSHTSDTTLAKQPNIGVDGTYWTIIGAEAPACFAAECVPVLYSPTYEATSDYFEVEFEYTYRDSTSNVFLSDSMVESGVGSSQFLFKMYDDADNRKAPVIYLRKSDTTVPYQYSNISVIPLNNGDRVKILAQINPTANTGTNCMFYSLWNAGANTWGTWTACGTKIWTNTEQWRRTANKFSVFGGVSSDTTPVQVHGLRVRKTQTNTATGVEGVVDFDASLDLWGGFGANGLAYLGRPLVRVWNASWLGAEITSFNGESNFANFNVSFDFDTDFRSPSNATLVFINLGHNGHIIPPDVNNATKLRKLIAKAKARFPRAQICVMSQNPGINGYQFIDSNKFNFAPAEPHKQMKKAYEARACLEDGHAFIDINRVFTNAGANALSLDGLHPNSAGSALWADTLYKAITGTLDQ